MTDIICPNCGSDMKTKIEEPSKAEKMFLKHVNNDNSLDNHIDIFRNCECGYRRHETWIGDEILSYSESFDENE